MSTIASTTSATASSTADAMVASIGGAKTLSQEDFLNLLIAQMKSQDPMNPQSDTQMAAQMAQFTSLQQSGTMSTNIASLLTQQQLLQANTMLGNTVSLQVDSKTIASGVVQSVQITGGVPQIVVNNTAYDLDQVLTITPTSSNGTPAAPATLTPSMLAPQTVASQTTP